MSRDTLGDMKTMTKRARRQAYEVYFLTYILSCLSNGSVAGIDAAVASARMARGA